MTDEIGVKNWEKKFDRDIEDEKKVYVWTGSNKMEKRGFPLYVNLARHKMHRGDVPHIESGDWFWSADFIREPWEGSGLDLMYGRVAWGKDFDAVKDALKEWMKKNKNAPSVPSQGLRLAESTYADRKKRKLNEEVL